MDRLLDANIIIRYLTSDDPKKAKAVEKLLKSSQDNSLILSDVTFAEIIWALTSHYTISKEEIIDKLQSLLRVPSIKANQEVLSLALSFYKIHNISFIDTYLAAYTDENNLDALYSYDRGIDKIKSIKRLEP